MISLLKRINKIIIVLLILFITGCKNEQQPINSCIDDCNNKTVEQEIVNMPNYFDQYDTTVNFITQEELDQGLKILKDTLDNI